MNFCSNKKIKILSLLLFLLSNIQIYSQTYETKSKRAKDAFDKALHSYKYMRANAPAIEELKDCLRFDPKHIDAWLLLAQIYMEIDSVNLQIITLTKAIELDAEVYPPAFVLRAEANLKFGKYEEALIDLELFVEKYKIGYEQAMLLAKRLRNNCYFSLESLRNPAKIDLHQLPDNINTRLDEYWPSFTVDNQQFYYTLKTPTGRGRYREDIYTCLVLDENRYSNPEPLSDPVNTHDNEGASFISPDGRYLFFTGCNRADGYGSCDIYMSVRQDDMWSKPKNVGKNVNTKYWESRPVISSDGNYLYFSSNRPGGYGKADIYVSEKKGADFEGFPIWGIPENLGPVINTPGDELAPFIHPDNKTLYFSSDFHTGMGGLDLFKSELVDGKWSEPVNLGYPINSYKSEIGIFVQSNGKQAFIDKEVEENGNRDIFTFLLPEKVQAGKATYVKGLVIDKESKNPISVNVEIYDFETSKFLMTIKSNSNGKFLVALAAGKMYGLTVERTGYLFYSNHFNIDDKEVETYDLFIELEPIKVGNRTILNNVFYETDKYVLSPESKIELNRIVLLLEQNPKLKVEISGHTDNTGTDAHNKKLSENRSKSVYDYIIENGVEVNRLTYKGYGATMPIDSNTTEEGKANNRRTEMKVMSCD